MIVEDDRTADLQLSTKLILLFPRISKPALRYLIFIIVQRKKDSNEAVVTGLTESEKVAWSNAYQLLKALKVVRRCGKSTYLVNPYHVPVIGALRFRVAARKKWDDLDERYD